MKKKMCIILKNIKAIPVKTIDFGKDFIIKELEEQRKSETMLIISILIRYLIDNRRKLMYFKELEAISTIKLDKTLPAVVRLDGKSFSSFTKNFKKPFCEVFYLSMLDTTRLLLKSDVQGIVGAVVASDEISIFLRSFSNRKGNRSGYFDFNAQKLASTLASRTTRLFNICFRNNVEIFSEENYEDIERVKALKVAIDMAEFDCRSFSLNSSSEIYDYLLNRQLDFRRNAINMAAREEFLHSDLVGVPSAVVENSLNKLGKFVEDKYKYGTMFIKSGGEVFELSSERVSELREEIEIIAKEFEYLED